jgi:manganese transport protein
MPELPHNNKSLGEIHESVDMTNTKPGWKKIFSFIGPA